MCVCAGLKGLKKIKMKFQRMSINTWLFFKLFQIGWNFRRFIEPVESLYYLETWKSFIFRILNITTFLPISIIHSSQFEFWFYKSKMRPALFIKAHCKQSFWSNYFNFFGPKQTIDSITRTNFQLNYYNNSFA